MKRDSKLSGVLHVLLHMAEAHGPVKSETMANMLHTNPVVIRRLLAGLRNQGFVQSEKGHGGGWRLSCDLSTSRSTTFMCRRCATTACTRESH